MSRNLDADKRAKRYWYTDGLSEIVGGINLLLLGAYFYSQAVLPEGTLIANILSSMFALILVGMVFVGKKVVEALKVRYTYPRTGFVSYKKKNISYKRLLLGITLAFTISATFAMIGSTSTAWMPGVTSVIVSGIFFLLAYRFDLTRFFILAGVSLLVGVGMALSGFGDIIGLSYYYMVMGLSVILSGLAAFQYYLRNTEYAEEKE